MKCTVCNEQIPEARLKVLPGVRSCVKCSTEDKWSAVPIIHHKTGNTIEIIKDRAVAEEFYRLSARVGFGTLRGLKAGVSGGTKTKLGGVVGSTAFIGTPETFHRIGEKAMLMCETFGIAKAEKIVEEAVRGRVISDSQGAKIMKLIRIVNEPAPVPQNAKPIAKYNPYSKYDPKPVKSEVSDEISYVFKNWKK